MPLEQFADVAYGTVASGGTTAPSAGTSQTWTVDTTSTNAFPGASNSGTPPTQFHISDPALPSETIAVTNVSGTTWTVTRGVDGTTPVAHSSGFTVYQVASAGVLGASRQVYNVRSVTYGATGNGSTDDYTAIQAALTACRTAGGGIVDVPEGTYITSESLQIGSNTWLRGPDRGACTIRAKASFAATQVGSGGTANTGMVMLATYANGATTVTDIKVTGITFDGNQTNIASVPGYADSPETSPVSLWNCDQVLVEDCAVINAIGYSVYLQNATRFTIRGNYVLSGQGGSSWANQDGIHITAGGTSQYGLITGNYVDTGTGSAGDDCIALQVYGTMADVIVSDNILKGGGGGNNLTVPLSATSATASNIVITGNDMLSSQNCGVYIYEDAGSSGWTASNITITGNSFAAYNGSGSGLNGAVVLSAGISWNGVVVSGNTIAAPASTTGGVNGIYAANGTNVTITGNQLAGIGGSGSLGIQVGDSGSPVTGFCVGSNVITCTTSGATAILIEDSAQGTVTGNSATGNTGGSSYGVHLLTSCVGVAITGNRLSAFATGIGESGTASSYNSCVGNALHGCTTGVGTFSGTGDISASNA